MNSVSLNQIAFNILNSLRGGRSSHTEHLSLEQVKFAVKYYRAMFIRRDMLRNANRYRMFEQDLGHLAVSTVDSAEDGSVTSGENVLRTDDQIPTPIRFHKWEGITHIGCEDKYDEGIPLVDLPKANWNQYNKYSSEFTQAVYRDGFIYIFNDISIDTINVRGVFEDPEEVHNFTRANGLDLYDEDSAFPISSDMLTGITQGLLKGELSLAVQSLNDTELDGIQSPRKAVES